MMLAQTPSENAERSSVRRPSGHALRVSDAKTRAAVAGRLLALGVPRTHLEDETQNVLRELFEVRDPPPTHDECIALARHIARQRAVDYLRKRARRAKSDAGPTDAADDYALPTRGGNRSDPVDEQRQLRLLQDQVASGDISQRQLAILADVADGVRHTEIAREMKLSPQTVRNELSLTRKTYRSAWARMTGSGALLLVAAAALTVIWNRDHGNVGTGRPPGWSMQPREPSPAERGAAIRDQALHDCDLARFAPCLEGLDRARDLDPDGDRAPRVEKARRDAHASLRSHRGG